MTFEEVLDKVKTVKAYLTEEDKKILYEYAGQVGDNGLIVDIGTAFGGSAFIMTISSKPSVKVITIDPIDNEFFKSFHNSLPEKDKLSYMKMTSLEAAYSWDKKEIDLLFIDGVHNYNGVSNDLLSWGTLVKTNGIILAHDYYLYDGIRNALEDAVLNGFMEKLDVVDGYFQNEKRIGMFIGKKL